jgi:hypothetical protein
VLLLIARLVLLALTAPRAGQASPVSSEVRAAMERINRALGVECTHCHIQDQWTDASKDAYATAKNMIAMVKAVNEQLAEVTETRVSCWTCHGGQTKPSRVPQDRMKEELEKWPAGLADDRRLAMSVYNVTLGVGCDHCHTADWKSDEKKPFRMVARMTRLFDLFPKYMPASARTQCFMCHKGQKKPEGGPA